MRKAQIQSQIFIYVFALLVISLIMFFGIRSISSFSENTSKVVLVNFVTGMKSKIISITSEYDSVEEVILDLSKDYEAVCFKSSIIYGSSSFSSLEYPNYAAILNEYASTDNNVFIIKKGGTLEQEFNAGKIQINNPPSDPPSNIPFCINNTLGSIKFKIVGKGRYAELKKVSP